MGKRGRPRYPDVLTPREWEVLSLLRENLTNEQIAERLGVTVHAARYHVSEILSKLGVATREEAAAWQPEETRAGPRWSIAFQIWLTAAAAVAVIGVGVLAWGVARGSGDDAQAGVVASMSPTASQATSTSGPPIPTFVASTRPPVGADVRAMQLVGIDTGIVLTHDALLRIAFDTLDTRIVIGPADITPVGIAATEINGVYFRDSDHGWVVANGPPRKCIGCPEPPIVYRTADGGKTWNSSLVLPDPDWNQQIGPGSPAYVYFLDVDTGWIVVKAETGTNFDVGTLYRTDNGGVNWTRLSIPIGDPVYFADANNGWTAGGVPFDSKLYVTHDGGASWNDASDITPVSDPYGPRAFGLPMAVNGGAQLLLPVTIATESLPTDFVLYSSTDGGRSWRQVALTPVGNYGIGSAVRSYTFASGAVVLFAAVGTGYQLAPGATDFESFTPMQLGDIRDIFTPTGLFIIESVDFFDRQHGWALAGDGGCERFKTDCWQATFIEQTYDGGQSWTPLSFGSNPTPAPTASQTPPSTDANLTYQVAVNLNYSQIPVPDGWHLSAGNQEIASLIPNDGGDQARFSLLHVGLPPATALGDACQIGGAVTLVGPETIAGHDGAYEQYCPGGWSVRLPSTSGGQTWDWEYLGATALREGPDAALFTKVLAAFQGNEYPSKP